MARTCLMPGCNATARPKGDYCKDAHRAAAHKLRKRMADGMLPAERRRERDKAAKRAARAGGVIPSDVRVSYERAIQVVARGLIELEVACDQADAIDYAERLLAPALPKRLRPEPA